MVKFSKYLACHLVPEWRPAYCNYRILKKELKRIKALRNGECRVLAKDAYIALMGPSLRKLRTRSPRPEVILVCLINSG
jgi:SPX domain protein involved in polyphosphate accumulation